MKQYLCYAALTVFAACNAQPPAGNGNAPAGKGFYLDEKAMAFKDLQLYPIRATSGYIDEHSHFGKYKTLKEGINAGTVKVSERSTDAPAGNLNDNVSGDAATVNTLLIENTSNDTVFLMAGELVKGGKQDRVIAQDMILPPKSGKQNLPVFCVEHGRWTYDNKEKAGEKASFSGYQNVSSNTVRKTVATEQNQSAVWRDVAVVTTANNADAAAGNTSGTYNGLENNGDFVKKRDEYLKYFKGAFDTTSYVIGVVAMSGDSVIGSDIFFSPELFKKQYGNLLYSYVTDAITKPGKSTDQKKAVDNFFVRVKKEYAESDSSKNKNQLQHKGKTMHRAAF
ncbi:MAG: hypothetical protein FD123_2096 [Bacteroidetes bacterium]|nr:MAG: hypothetical protein FD123_2096 [Bacteroidota bacterium]